MHEMAEKYLEERKVKMNEDMQKHLISLGLWEKEFGEFEWGEYDEETGKTYQKKAIPVTDEEYELICRAQPGQQTAFNLVSVTCTVLAYIVFVVGFAIGIIMGNTANVNTSGFSFMAAAAVWMNAFLIGFFFLISAQIIKLLQKIANQTVSKS